MYHRHSCDERVSRSRPSDIDIRYLKCLETKKGIDIEGNKKGNVENVDTATCGSTTTLNGLPDLVGAIVHVYRNIYIERERKN